MTQNNLGNALPALGERESSPVRLGHTVDAHTVDAHTVDAHTKALKVFNAQETPRYREIAQNNLARALKLLRERRAEPGPEDTPG